MQESDKREAVAFRNAAAGRNALGRSQRLGPAGLAFFVTLRPSGPVATTAGDISERVLVTTEPDGLRVAWRRNSTDCQRTPASFAGDANRGSADDTFTKCT